MALNRSDKSRILRRYFPGMTRNSEMSTEPSISRKSGIVSRVKGTVERSASYRASAENPPVLT